MSSYECRRNNDCHLGDYSWPHGILLLDRVPPVAQPVNAAHLRVNTNRRNSPGRPAQYLKHDAKDERPNPESTVVNGLKGVNDEADAKNGSEEEGSAFVGVVVVVRRVFSILEDKAVRI